MKPVLYSYYRSSCSYRIRIALEFLEQNYEYKSIHLVKSGGEQHSKDYLELNPMKQVPYYIDEVVSLSQSMAILEHLNSVHSSKLIPTDLNQAAKVREFCEVINSGIQPIQNLAVLKKLGTEASFDSEQKAEWIRHFIRNGFLMLERLLSNSEGKFCFNSFTAADAMLIPQVYNANRFELNMDEFPKIKSVNEHCLSLDYFQKAHPSSQDDAE